MAYEFYITRGKSNDSKGRKPLTLSEWKKYVDKNSELYLEEDVEFEGMGEMNSWGERGNKKENHPGRANLKGCLNSYGREPTFFLDFGILSIKNPEIDAIEKMVKIAKDLDARVFDDDDNEYDEEWAKQSKKKIKNEPFRNKRQSPGILTGVLMKRFNTEYQRDFEEAEKELEEIDAKYKLKLKKLFEELKSNEDGAKYKKKAEKVYNELEREFEETHNKWKSQEE